MPKMVGPEGFEPSTSRFLSTPMSFDMLALCRSSLAELRAPVAIRLYA